MRVVILAHTFVINDPPGWDGTDGYASDIDTLAEMAGRNCYQSWNRPNPATAKNYDYIGNIIGQGHFSVLEHASVTFHVSGISTALLGQLTRHRHLSFSVESARYVDKSGKDMIFGDSMVVDDQLRNAVNVALAEYSRQVDALTRAGCKTKQARQVARLILPQGISTNLVVTGNMRAWREFLGKRLSPGADVEIRNLAKEILSQLKIIAPGTFQDMEEQ